jgi:uncharacterized protein YceH (UPF0502 family)
VRFVLEASPAEIRVLGCLIEKQRTTPDAYPLSLNALRLACNQTTNRDPVVEYDDATVRAAAQRLGRRGWTRFASGPGSRAPKYRHMLGEALHLADDELALLCVLMLRGPQTPGELKARTERLHAFPDLPTLEATLAGLVDRELVSRLERRPGQKEQRYRQLLGGESAAAEEQGLPERSVAADAPDVTLDGRVARLEEELGALRAAVEELRSELGA